MQALVTCPRPRMRRAAFGAGSSGRGDVGLGRVVRALRARQAVGGEGRLTPGLRCPQASGVLPHMQMLPRLSDGA